MNPLKEISGVSAVPSVAASDLFAKGTHEWRAAAKNAERSSDAFAASIVSHFSGTLGRDLAVADAEALYTAVALAVRERLMGDWRTTRHATVNGTTRRTCYLSLEFLMGRALGNALLNLNLYDAVQEALATLGLNLADIEELEPDAGLGNGGLGRLAACFMDSCAALALPVTGYGLRYRYGMFRQSMDNGHQVERPDDWLAHGHPWEVSRPELTRTVKFGGHVEVIKGESRERRRWVSTEDVEAVPSDVPVPGTDNGVVNTLRLWSAHAVQSFDLGHFNAGGYAEAVAAQSVAENITMVLYPNDASENGKILRLRQQYFLVSASLQDAMSSWLAANDDLTGFADSHCFQLNDTHPSLAVAELMRLLMDEHDLEWDAAWAITRRTMAYTNHTLLPEALEQWPLGMIERLLPRPIEICHEINRRFLAEVDARWPGDEERRRAMSIVQEGHEPMLRMAHLAIVGSYSINGVAALHSELLRTGLFSHFAELWPERFNNKTNGVTQRRWLSHCNPTLASLLDESVGAEWVQDMSLLEKLAPLAKNAEFCNRWQEVRRVNRQALAQLVFERTGVQATPDMLMDVQVKRIHEYKRQLLCVLHVVHCWLEQGGGQLHTASATPAAPRCVIIAGKAAPGYRMAKSIIRLCNAVADVINADPATGDTLKFVFLPDYNVSAMEVICPGTDLSEQISTAGKEASGTGNMKFMMNGAVTIGTLDGANVEILEAVGEENFFRFGLDVAGVASLRANYDPGHIAQSDKRVARVLEAFDTGVFDPADDPDGVTAIREAIAAVRSGSDPWMTIADLPAYLDTQAQVDAAWTDQESWTQMSILNTAFSGRFSTDRTMHDYNRDIWRLEPLVLGQDIQTRKAV
jgi:starch phosphorylase